MDVFVENCAIFIQCNDEKRMISEQLMDVYLYYAISGLNHCSPKTRAASLSILNAIVSISGNVIDILDKTFEPLIIDMIDDSNGWWEISANLIILCCTLLLRFNYRHPISSKVYHALSLILNKKEQCGKVIKIALHCMSSSVEAHTQMHSLFTHLLLKNDAIRRQLLSNKQFSQQICFSYGSVAKIECMLHSQGWKGWIPCLCVAQSIKNSNVGNLQAAHLEIILAAIGHLTEFPMEESVEWKQVFVELKPYLLVELCDPSSCVSISQCLLKFIVDRNICDEAVKLIYDETSESAPPLFGVLKLVFGNGSNSVAPICQQTLFDFIGKLLADQRFETVMKKLLNMFYRKYPIQFSQSPLSNFMEQLSIKPIATQQE